MRIIIIIIFIDIYKFTACLSVFPALIIVFAACSYICCVQLRTPYNIAIKRCPEISIIIGLIALLIVLFEFIGGFNDGWSDVDKLAPISIESADPAFDKVTATTFDVLPDSAIQAANSQAGTTVPTGFMQCHSYIVPSGLTNFTYILLGLTGLVSFYGLYNLIRLFISIIRKEVFTSINIRRIRWGVYPPIADHLVKYFLNWSETREAMAQLTIQGYTIQPASPFEFSWIGILLLILLTEVFVVAVKLKQETDWTI